MNRSLLSFLVLGTLTGCSSAPGESPTTTFVVELSETAAQEIAFFFADGVCERTRG